MSLFPGPLLAPGEVPSTSQLKDAASQSLQSAMTVAEYQLPNGTRVRRPDVGALLDAQERLAAQVAAANGDGCMQTVQIGRLTD